MTVSDPSEDPLVALRCGDPQPLERFVHARASHLHAYFRRRGARAEVAEDLTQESLMRLCKAAPQYEPRERFEAYVARVISSVWIDHCRRARSAKQQQFGAEQATELECDQRAIDADLAQGDEVARLRQALRGLSTAHRETLELALLHGLAYAEVGSLLGVPVGTVKSRVFHALSKLRLVLDPEREALR
jgi:RNA polymerase sigma-70 factor (ECF subfamily)